MHCLAIDHITLGNCAFNLRHLLMFLQFWLHEDENSSEGSWAADKGPGSNHRFALLLPESWLRPSWCRRYTKTALSEARSQGFKRWIV